MIDYKLLEALALVIAEGGFEKAANKLHITQSAVSQRVKMLEETAGQILVTRTLPPLATEAGLRILAHYRKVKLLEEELVPEISINSASSPATLALGVNADSLATWFLDAVENIASDHNLILDIHVDDQEQTQKLLQNGQVCGCISTHNKQLQGCRVEQLGSMEYGLYCTPAFARKWFQGGFGLASLQSTPSIRFNRVDNLNKTLFHRLFQRDPGPLPTFYVPSSEKIVDCVLRSLCYGAIPGLQSKSLCREGLLIDLAPACKVEIELYYHCWNLKSKTIENFTRQFIAKAREILRACQ